MQNIQWRRICQVLCAALTNSYLYTLVSRTIYLGRLKGFCVPALNCYACPLAVFACPIGTIQHFVAHGAYHITLYTVGILGITGALVGRMACGWGCPFGLLQDLTFKIRSRKFSLPGWLTYGKYAALAILVIIIPLITRQPWFCKLCPAGTLEAGIPLVLTDADLRTQAGWLFAVKVVILLGFLIWMMSSKRPFCRFVCPLGAIWSPFNRVSSLRLSVDLTTCTECDACREVCPVDICIYEDPDSSRCIRCMECIKVCPQACIALTAE